MKKLIRITLVVVLVIILAVFVYAAFQDVFSASFVTAVATSILVLVTAGYAILTFDLVRETRKGREQAIQPVFKLDLEPWAMNTNGVLVENIGNGPAQDIDAILTLGTNDQQAAVRAQNVPPGDSIPILQPFDDIQLNKDLLDDYSTIEIDGTYKDIFGNQEEFSDKFDLELLKYDDGAWLYRDNTEKYLKDIAKETKKLREEVNGVEGEIKKLKKKF